MCDMGSAGSVRGRGGACQSDEDETVDRLDVAEEVDRKRQFVKANPAKTLIYAGAAMKIGSSGLSSKIECSETAKRGRIEENTRMLSKFRLRGQ